MRVVGIWVKIEEGAGWVRKKSPPPRRSLCSLYETLLNWNLRVESMEKHWKGNSTPKLLLNLRVVFEICKTKKHTNTVKLGYNDLGYNDLGYNDLGYNEFTAITNKNLRSRRVRYNRVWLYFQANMFEESCYKCSIF